VAPRWPSFNNTAVADGPLLIIPQLPWVLPPNQLDKVQGYVKFEGIKFRYPTRPEVPILQGIDLEIKPGQTVALVGPSGCGKSTTVSLLQRFYDPLEGRVLVDGHDIKEVHT